MRPSILLGAGEAPALWPFHLHHEDQEAGIFLQDYYSAVRAIWNLPVRIPYQEEYLGGEA